jgi:hypothetical protein
MRFTDLSRLNFWFVTYLKGKTALSKSRCLGALDCGLIGNFGGSNFKNFRWKWRRHLTRSFRGFRLSYFHKNLFFYMVKNASYFLFGSILNFGKFIYISDFVFSKFYLLPISFNIKEPFIFSKWFPGTLTNFKVLHLGLFIQSRIFTVVKGLINPLIIAFDRLKLTVGYKRFWFYCEGLKALNGRFPSFGFIMNIHDSVVSSSEFRLKLCPSIGLLNISEYLFDYTIFGNASSPFSSILFTNIFLINVFAAKECRRSTFGMAFFLSKNRNTLFYQLMSFEFIINNFLKSIYLWLSLMNRSQKCFGVVCFRYFFLEQIALILGNIVKVDFFLYEKKSFKSPKRYNRFLLSLLLNLLNSFLAKFFFDYKIVLCFNNCVSYFELTYP